MFLGGLVYSWGDGDFGKLGRGNFQLAFHTFPLYRCKLNFCFSLLNEGGSEGCSSPCLVDKLSGLGVCHVECGAQFSVALTCNGHVICFSLIHPFIILFVTCVPIFELTWHFRACKVCL